MSNKSILPVVCAVVMDGNKVLAVKKSERQSYPNMWEFPGGKTEAGESDKHALRRELEEELQIEILANMKLPVVWHEEENRIIELRPYLCEILLGEIQLVEHQEFKWVDETDILSLDWAPADRPVAQEVRKLLLAI